MERCIACNRCAEVCPAERPNAFNYGLDTTKAAYLPNPMAFPMKYVIDPATCQGTECSACVEACPTNAIDLTMESKTITLRVGAIILATGWKPYDANKLTILGYADHPDVINNVEMERLAAVDGPTGGCIKRPSDGREAKRVAFVQCAGSRDVNHLPYCSSICCLGSIKEATYVRSQYPDSEVFIFYIDIRAPGRNEDFYHRIAADPGVHFIKGKVAKVGRDPATGDMVVEADDMLSGAKTRTRVDLVVLATGMVPSMTSAEAIPGLPVEYDEYGFALENREAGCVRGRRRPSSGRRGDVGSRFHRRRPQGDPGDALMTDDDARTGAGVQERSSPSRAGRPRRPPGKAPPTVAGARPQSRGGVVVATVAPRQEAASSGPL